MSRRQEILEEIALAERLEHPYRLIRFTFECGHFKLSEYSASAGGIGFSAMCKICSECTDKQITREIVNAEETGALGRFICFES